MSLSGNLEDLSLADIIQIIHLSSKTGTLFLQGKSREGTVVFRAGFIVQAHTDTIDETILSIVKKRQTIPPDMLQRALSYRDEKFKDRPLLPLLYRLKLLTSRQSAEVLREQIVATVIDLLEINEGNFNFELAENLEAGATRLTAGSGMLKEGLSPQSIFSEAARIIENERPVSGSEKSDQPSAVPSPAPVDYQSTPSVDTTVGTTIESIVTSEVQQSSVIDVVAGGVKEEVETDASSSENGVERQKESRVILIVDDEKLFLQQLSKILKRKGFEVYAFPDIEQAIEQLETLLQENIHPILVSDIVFPTAQSSAGLGGIEFLERINLRYPHIPVIILSDQLDPSLRFKAYEHGARNYLYKPDRSQMTVSELPQQIKQFVNELSLCLNNIFRERVRLSELMRTMSTIRQAFPAETLKVEESKAIDEAEMMKMKQIFYELQNPRETSEVILLVLRLASEHLERGILFLSQENSFRGIGGFGYALDGSPITHKLPSLLMTLIDSDFFKQVILTTKMQKVEIPAESYSESLFSIIGRPLAGESVIIPLLSEGRIVALFYGDNGSSMRELQSMAGLELFINQAGIALENALLQKKLKGKIN